MFLNLEILLTTDLTLKKKKRERREKKEKKEKRSK